MKNYRYNICFMKLKVKTTGTHLSMCVHATSLHPSHNIPQSPHLTNKNQTFPIQLTKSTANMNHCDKHVWVDSHWDLLFFCTNSMYRVSEFCKRNTDLVILPGFNVLNLWELTFSEQTLCTESLSFVREAQTYFFCQDSMS